MANKRYQSRFGASAPITFAQYAAEAMCARQAALRSLTLRPRFWEDPEWGRLYRLQVMLASGLLARFDEDLISAVLRSPQGRTVCTLRNPRLVALLEAEKQRRERLGSLRSAFEAETSPAPPSGLPAGPRATRPRPGNLFDSIG